jgi:hypothetical protein
MRDSDFFRLAEREGREDLAKCRTDDERDRAAAHVGLMILCLDRAEEREAPMPRRPIPWKLAADGRSRTWSSADDPDMIGPSSSPQVD